MPLSLPNLDDRHYDDLVTEALRLIPNYAPQWTNHNPSDPGITLLELFAYLSEMLLYRLNRVTAHNVLSFLKLLNGAAWNPFPESLTPVQIEARMQQLSAAELSSLIATHWPATVRQLRQVERAVSSADFELLAQAAGARVARVRCVPRRNLELHLEREEEGHVSLLVLPQKDANELATLEAVRKYLEPRLLLTTRLHVVKSFFLPVNIKTTLVPMPDRRAEELKPFVVKALTQFLTPFPDAVTEGWPFGRDLFASELFALLDRIPGVDYVKSLTLGPAERQFKNSQGEVIGLTVKPHELVQLTVSETDVLVDSVPQ